MLLLLISIPLWRLQPALTVSYKPAPGSSGVTALLTPQLETQLQFLGIMDADTMTKAYQSGLGFTAQL